MIVTPAASCRDCGGQIERVDGPPGTYWFHTSEAEAQWCPGSGPVGPDDPPEWEPDEDEAAESAAEYRARYAIEELAHGWLWTYSDITEAEAHAFAHQLTRPGECWTVRELADR